MDETSQPQEEIVEEVIEEVQTTEQKTSKLKEWMLKLKHFVNECIRVVRVTKKPNKEEFKTVVKVSAAGMGIIGAIGFAVYILGQFIKF